MQQKSLRLRSLTFTFRIFSQLLNHFFLKMNRKPQKQISTIKGNIQRNFRKTKISRGKKKILKKKSYHQHPQKNKETAAPFMKKEQDDITEIFKEEKKLIKIKNVTVEN